MCASPGIARATCAPDSHHLQLSAVLVHALGSFAATPHAKAMAMQVSRARRTQCRVEVNNGPQHSWHTTECNNCKKMGVVSSIQEEMSTQS